MASFTNKISGVGAITRFYQELVRLLCHMFFFFNDTATTEIYTLSLHDALPIFDGPGTPLQTGRFPVHLTGVQHGDRKSTRLNSSHSQISYAVFCLKKKINTTTP